MFRSQLSSKFVVSIMALILSGCGQHSTKFFGAVDVNPQTVAVPQKEVPSKQMLTAIETDSVTLVQKILDAGFPIDTVLEKGRTALLQAVDFNRPQIVKLLVDRGANPDLRDDEGKSARDLAQGKPEIEGILNPEIMLKLRAELLQAVLDDDRKRIKTYLIEEKRDPNFIENESGETPLTLAIIKVKSKAVKMMLHPDTRTDPRLPNRAGRTPLDLATELGQQNVIDFLKEKMK